MRPSRPPRFDIESVATKHGGEPKERVSFAMSPETLPMRLRVRETARR